MSACKSRSFLQLLVFCKVLVAAGQPDSRKPNEVLFGAMGSSIMLPGFSKEDFKNVKHVKWTFSKTKILDYYSVTNIPTFTNFYKYRSQFFSSNGSLLLKTITQNDSGLYEVQINLSTTKVFQLHVLVALSEPSVSNNSTDLGATIALNCGVSVGEVESRLWWKDGKLVMSDQQHWLLQDNSTLIIIGAKKSDCGNYTCSLENSVSSKNISHWLPISGIPRMVLCTMVLSIVALIFALSVFMGIILLCFHFDSNRIGTDFQGKALKYLQIASLLSLITLLAAFACSTQSSEYSEIKTFMMVVLCVLILLVIFLIYSMSSWNSESFNKILRYKICSVTVDAVTPVSGIVVICASAIMLARIAKQADKGCEPPHNLQSSIIPAVVGPMLICGGFFAVYVHKYKERLQRRRGQAVNPNEENAQQCQGPEQVPLQIISGENGSSTRAPACGEDSCPN